MKNLRNSLFLILATLLAVNSSYGQIAKDYLFSSEIEAKVKAEKEDWNLQNYAVQYSLSGNYKASLETHDLFVEKNRQRVNFPKEEAVDAVKAVAGEAEKYQVVITNEEHYQPQNRVFTTSLLVELYKKGFRYLSCEDLAPEDANFKSKTDVDLNSRKYPIKSTGYYINEPQYGNLVREALRIGYKLFVYEDYASAVKDPTERFVAREKGQARNIAEFLKQHPAAKILIHSGRGHLNELLKNKSGLMGAMLKQEFNIDPLTVDQFSLLEEKRSPYLSLLPAVNVSSVLVDKQNSFFSVSNNNFKVDMSVIFPKTQYINGRPNWLMYPKNRKYYFVRKENLKLNYPLMIAAYRKGEDMSRDSGRCR